MQISSAMCSRSGIVVKTVITMSQPAVVFVPLPDVQIRLIPEAEFVVLRRPSFRSNRLIWRVILGGRPGVSRARSRFSLYYPLTQPPLHRIGHHLARDLAPPCGPLPRLGSTGSPLKGSSTSIRFFSGTAERLQPPHGFRDQPVDDGGERLAVRRAIGERAVEDHELAMGARAAGEDLAGVRDLGEAAEMARIGIDERQHLVEQLGIGKDGTTAEIDETLVGAVALRPPAVLVDQHARIDPPALVLAFEAPQHAQQAPKQRGDR